MLFLHLNTIYFAKTVVLSWTSQYTGFMNQAYCPGQNAY